MRGARFWKCDNRNEARRAESAQGRHVTFPLEWKFWKIDPLWCVSRQPFLYNFCCFSLILKKKSAIFWRKKNFLSLYCNLNQTMKNCMPFPPENIWNLHSKLTRTVKTERCWILIVSKRCNWKWLLPPLRHPPPP